MEESFLESEMRQFQQTIQRKKRMKIVEASSFELSLADHEVKGAKATTSCHTFTYTSSGVMMPTTSNQTRKRPSRQPQARLQCNQLNQGFETGCDHGVGDSMDVAGKTPSCQYINY